jgi:putative tricarboxylic transport membrane protein
MIQHGYGTIPLLLGMVLGDMAEKNFHRALIMSDGHYDIFWSSWIARILLALSILSIVWPYAKLVCRKSKPRGTNMTNMDA